MRLTRIATSFYSIREWKFSNSKQRECRRHKAFWNRRTSRCHGTCIIHIWSPTLRRFKHATVQWKETQQIFTQETSVGVGEKCSICIKICVSAAGLWCHRRYPTAKICCGTRCVTDELHNCVVILIKTVAAWHILAANMYSYTYILLGNYLCVCILSL